MTECGKIPYATRDLGIAALANARERYKRSGKASDWRRLHVYQCDRCEGVVFHLGRRQDHGMRQQPSEVEATPQKKQPRAKPVKVPSSGDLRRRMRRITEKLDGERLHKLYLLGVEIQAEQRRAYEEALRMIGWKPE